MSSTNPSKSRIWSEFKKWCAVRKLKALPAHPWTIAAYLRWSDRRLGAKAAHAALDAISREHVLRTMRAPTRHAIVVRTLEMIDRRAEVRDQHAALFDEKDALGDAPPAGPRQDDVPEPVLKPGRRVLSTQPRLKRRRPPAKG